MGPAGRFRLNPDRVVHETIDGETIIIQLETGTYYSLAGSGAEIWAMLAAGRSAGEVVGELEQRYAGSRDELAEATDALVRELRREELLEEGTDEDANAPSSNGASANGGGDHANAERPQFDPPKLQRYTDMQYFLMLDPIHEVDAIGWPNPPSE